MRKEVRKWARAKSIKNLQPETEKKIDVKRTTGLYSTTLFLT